MVHGEVLDVDPGVAERDHDLAEHAGAVADGDDEAVEVARRQTAGGEHAFALLRSANDRVAEPAGIVRGQRFEHLLQAVLEGRQRGQQSSAVLEEDVGPDAAVAAGDAREVAKARAGGEQRVARARVLPSLTHEDVGEHVRQVADHRHHAVVFLRVDGDRPRADLAEKPVEQLVGVGVDVRPGRHEVGGALEERCPGVGHAGRLGAAQRVTAHAAPLFVRRERPHERALGAAHVADHGVRRGRGARRLDVLGNEPHRRAHEDEIRA